MTGFLVSASTGPMNSLLCKLVTLLGDEYKLLKGIRKEIRALRDELSSMNSFLHKLSDVGGDELDVQRKEWRNKVRELAYDIEDCIDIFMHQLRHPGGGHSRSKKKAGLIRRLTMKIKMLRRGRRIAVQIQQLKSRVVEESGRRDRYKLDDDVPSCFSKNKNRLLVEIDPRLPAMYSEAKCLVGIGSPRDEIIHWLTADQKLTVVSIVGFGGVGKTTLANQVYCKIKDSFECTAFVSVSQNPDLLRILRDMLSQLGCCRMRNLNDQQKVIEKIRERLSHKRYLIVVDDIWNIQAWDTIRCAFVQDNDGSRVITTTRNEQVAIACCSYCHNHIFKMKPLNDIDSRRLFFRRIFGSEDACPEQYEAVSEKILKKCGGVPLVIISISSLLASQECLHKEKWEKVQKSLVFELETSPDLGWVRYALNLSYNDLSHPLKTCFLYLGIYPEDHKIEKANLLRRWIAEGFVSHEHDYWSPEEVAESYFNELLNRSIIQPAGFEYGELTYCKVHDILLDFIMLKSSEENFITRMDEQHSSIKGAHEVRRLCFQLKNAHLLPANMKLSQIRSVTIFGYPDCLPYLPRFQLLRVLDLYYCDKLDGTTEFLDLSSICKLFHLRYLRTNSHQLQLPKQIVDLENLETMDIRDAVIHAIPSDVPHLKSLRHLNIPIDVKLPDGIGKMVTLRALGFFNVAENSIDNVRDLGELTNLMELDLIWTKQVVKAHGPCEKLKISFLIDSLGKLTNLRSLYISSIDTKLISPTCDFLSCWCPPPRNLQRLSLSFCSISKVPQWVSQLDKLTSLKIKVKQLQGDAVRLLGELPCLIYLDLSANIDPKHSLIFYSNAYPSLKEFGFACTFASVAFEPRSMAKLQMLHLSFCKARKQQQEEDVCLTGVEHLLSIEKLTARIYHGGRIGLSFMDAILRHPRSQSFNIVFPRC